MTREEAVKILNEIIDEGWLISDNNKCSAINACEMAIKALEQQKIGKWMRLSIHDWEFDCSECCFDSDEPYPYCPGCGAKMEERNEDSD